MPGVREPGKEGADSFTSTKLCLNFSISSKYSGGNKPPVLAVPVSVTNRKRRYFHTTYSHGSQLKISLVLITTKVQWLLIFCFMHKKDISYCNFILNGILKL